MSYDITILDHVLGIQPGNPVRQQIIENTKNIQDLRTEISELRSNINQLDPKSFPRFLVWRSGTMPAEKHEPLIYDKIGYNDGNMYDVNTGIVTVKYDGMYLFSANLLKSPESGRVSYYIFVNEDNFGKSTT